jgi:hypothetical protein
MRVLPTPPDPHSQSAIFNRLVGAGVRAEAIAKAIALLRTGRADLIQDVIDGKLDVERACRAARARRQP